MRGIVTLKSIFIHQIWRCSSSISMSICKVDQRRQMQARISYFFTDLEIKVVLCQISCYMHSISSMYIHVAEQKAIMTSINTLPGQNMLALCKLALCRQHNTSLQENLTKLEELFRQNQTFFMINVHYQQQHLNRLTSVSFY